MSYDDYLRTREWRKTRDRALRRAGWTCMRCPQNKTLQVHHKSYEHLGEERDSELEVLCETCHQGHHINEEKQARGVYARVISQVLKTEKFTSMAELLAAVKDFCGRQHIPYDGPKIWRAVQLVDANRKGIADAPRMWEHRPERFAHLVDQPIGKAEASSMLRGLGIKVSLHKMPKAIYRTEREILAQRAMDQVSALILESLKKCEELEKAIDRD